MNSERQKLSFRFGQYTHIIHNRNLPQHTYFERQNAPKRVRDEKEVKEAKASSPKERLRVRRKDSEEREMQKVIEKGKDREEG